MNTISQFFMQSPYLAWALVAFAMIAIAGIVFKVMRAQGGQIIAAGTKGTSAAHRPRTDRDEAAI